MSTQLTGDAPVLLHVQEGLARITLNRPGSLNAFDADMAHAWAAATTEAVHRDDVRAVIIDAAGRAFCAGGDVAAMAGGIGDEGIEELASTINVGIRALTESSLPVVAAAHGTTAGGGLGIMLTADYVIVGEGSQVGSIYANVGLTPDLSVSEQLTRAIGERRALQLVLTDRLISADTALDWGLVTEVVPDDRVLARAEEVASVWLRGASGAYGQAKRLIRSRPTRTAPEQLAEEARTIANAYLTEDAQQRIRAFAARSAKKD